MKSKLLYIITSIFLLAVCSYFYIQNVKSKRHEATFDLEQLSYVLPIHNMICLPNIKFICSSQEKCYQVKPTVFTLFDGSLDIFYRCDNKSCDSYEVRADKSGDYTNFTPMVPNGTMWKVNTDGDYAEIATLGTETFISYGKCK